MSKPNYSESDLKFHRQFDLVVKIVQIITIIIGVTYIMR